MRGPRQIFVGPMRPRRSKRPVPFFKMLDQSQVSAWNNNFIVSPYRGITKYILNRFSSIYFRVQKRKCVGKKQKTHEMKYIDEGEGKFRRICLGCQPNLLPNKSLPIIETERQSAPPRMARHIWGRGSIPFYSITSSLRRYCRERRVYIHFPASGVVKLNGDRLGKEIHVLLVYEDEATKAEDHRESVTVREI